MDSNSREESSPFIKKKILTLVQNRNSSHLCTWSKKPKPTQNTYNRYPLIYHKMVLHFSNSSEVELWHMVSGNEVTRHMAISIKENFSWNKSDLKSSTQLKYKGQLQLSNNSMPARWQGILYYQNKLLHFGTQVQGEYIILQISIKHIIEQRSALNWPQK